MEFTNRFHIPLPLEDAWTLMLDVPRILPCLPGARLTGTAGADQYLGSVSVKLGPIKLSFDGRAELLRKDAATHTAWLRGSGLDPKGRGAAQSEFSFALAEAAAGGTDVTVRTDLQLSGAVAQYGRGRSIHKAMPRASSAARRPSWPGPCPCCGRCWTPPSSRSTSA